MCLHDLIFGTNKNRILKYGSYERALYNIKAIGYEAANLNGITANKSCKGFYPGGFGLGVFVGGFMSGVFLS